jgi:hypothetical protein
MGKVRSSCGEGSERFLQRVGFSFFEEEDMTNLRKIAAAALGLALAGGGSVASAQDQDRSAVANEPEVFVLSTQPQALPPAPAIEQDQNGTRYVSGGVSQEERDLMRDLARGFPLRIVSAAPQGNLVSDVAIAISDTRGRSVLAVEDAGPVVYVALPPGKYKVNVNNGGRVVSRQVVVARGRPQELAFFWPGEAPG